MSRKQETIRIVGVGSSAGGLQPFIELLENLPAKAQQCYVFVQHLDANRQSQLSAILGEHTDMPVVEIEHGMRVTNGTSYVVPAGYLVTMDGNKFRLEKHNHHDQVIIDTFFTSLADNHGPNAVGIVLSGAGSDGTDGLKHIKARGGTVYAQDDSAEYTDMPVSARTVVTKGHVAAPSEIARRLIVAPRGPMSDDDAIESIVQLLESETHIDFSKYKDTSVRRRIVRRKQLKKATGLADYYRTISENQAEMAALAKDMLIHVSSFFRDEKQYAALPKMVLSKIIESDGIKELRLWVPGCSTGEEVYSLAIVVDEFITLMDVKLKYTIVGTDIDPDCIKKAIQGIYPDSISQQLSTRRLVNYFEKTGSSYQVVDSIKQRCEFRVHDITKAVPLRDIDIVSCHNTFIYLGTQLQTQALATIYQALRPGGYLLLGKSEGLQSTNEMFQAHSATLKIYIKKSNLSSGTQPAGPIVEIHKDDYISDSLPHRAVTQADDSGRQLKITKLREALSLTQEYSDEILSELEVLNEELQTANEEMESANEELRTINEELSTVQEELQTSNEELQAINEELEVRNDELVATRDYAEAIIRTVREPLIILDADLRVHTANSAFYEAFEVKQKNTEGELLFQLGNGQWNIPGLKKLLRDILPHEQTLHDYVVNHEFETIGRKVMMLNATTLKQGPDQQPLILLAIEDISESRAAAAEIESTKEMFDALFDSTVVSIALADTDGYVLKANKTFLNQFGYTTEDLERGLNSTSISGPDEQNVTNQLYRSVRETGESLPLNKTYVRKDGTTFPALVGAARLPHNHDKFMAFVIDISETENLKRLNKTKDEFIALASHQLRTPATAVRQYLGVLLENYAGPMSDEQTRLLETANKANTRQLDIINDLLKTAQIDNAKNAVTIASHDMVAIVTDMVEEYRPVTEAKNQTISFKYPIKPLMAQVDKNEISICIANLLENASKYSESGKTVHVSLKKTAKAVVLSVRDEGVGIAVEDQELILEKFVRVDNKLSDTVDGSGLGLYLVKRIVDLHGGSLEIRSEVGKGTTFIIRLQQ